MSNTINTKGASTGVLLVALMLLLLGLTPLLVISPQRMTQFIALELRMYEFMIGQDAATLREMADAEYLRTAGPPPAVNSQWLIDRLHVLHLMYYLLIYRAMFLSSWTWPALGLVAGFVLYGQMRRLASQWNFSYVSPLKRRTAMSMLAACVALFVVALFLPAPMPAFVLPLSVAAIGYGLKLWIESIQKRV